MKHYNGWAGFQGDWHLWAVHEENEWYRYVAHEPDEWHFHGLVGDSWDLERDSQNHKLSEWVRIHHATLRRSNS